MTHNDDKIVGFRRDSADGSDSFLVFAHQGEQPREGYPVTLPEGNWKEVFNTDAQVYGGENFGNGGRVLEGGQSEMNLPAGGTVVFQKV